MSFIFNGDDTPEQAAKRRQFAMDSLQHGASQQPQNAGQGMSAIAQALAYRRMQGQQPQTGGADAWGGMRQAGGFPASIMKLFG